MSDIFTQRRDSSNRQLEEESFVISDSDEEFVEDSIKGLDKLAIVLDESNDDTYVSEDTTSRKSTDDDDTPVVRVKKNMNRHIRKFKILDSDESMDDDNKGESRTTNDSYSVTNTSDSDEDYTEETHDWSISYSPVKKNSKKRKDISHDTTREDIKELKHSSSNESLNFPEVPFVVKESGVKNKTSHDSPMIMLDSGSESEGNAAALSLANEEIGVGNIDPLVAQKRALTVCKVEQLKTELAKAKLLLVKGNIEVLPDKGEKLHDSIRMQEKEIEKLTRELENMPLVRNFNIKETETTKKSIRKKDKPLFTKNEPLSIKDDPYLDIDNILMQPTTLPELRILGKKAQATRDKELALTAERLEDLHGSLLARPSESERAKDPWGLKVELMPHQQHALAWILWREQQRPSGGVLADDMGLGKTLTMISLIMTTLAEKDFERHSDDEWHSERRPSYPKGDTLVVCPASLLSQWEGEVQNRCKRGLLSVMVYHGSNREHVPKRLASYDIVLTTYNILSREHKANSTLFKINWKRVILDEAHVIKNHKSQASEAACALVASKRWALTGTPIQNKELDLYSILKFLKCSPFDDLRVWRRWVDNKNSAGHQRLATVMKTLMLRRTKQELMAKGDLENLPDKSIEEVTVKLDPQEQLVYEKILIYSRTLFAQFLAQRAEKNHMMDLYRGKYDKPTFLSNPNKQTQFTKAQNKLLAMHADVKAHEILVLLLRLRQVCCHPAMIHAMLDQEDVKESGIMDMENMDPDLMARLNNMSINGIENSEEDVGIDRRITQNLLTAENPVFDDDRVSSKMGVLLDMVKEILQKGDDKIIIVSQWATLLNVVASHLSLVRGATFSKFAGSVAIKDRQSVVESFNNPNSDPRILLLSLTAGGVGLNLVGANHLLLFDIHWNPQLETQAQDRIYRFGQTKNVYIYKFICTNTIEERIKRLQEHKIQIAQNVLSGNGSNVSSKLTLNDLKELFAL